MFIVSNKYIIYICYYYSKKFMILYTGQNKNKIKEHLLQHTLITF